MRTDLATAALCLGAALLGNAVHLPAPVVLHAQSTPAPAFDTVSIKRNTSGGAGMRMGFAPGSVSALNVPAWQLIREAYGLQEPQLTGGPDWVPTDRFDVEARFDPTPLPGFDRTTRLQAMLQQMLGERFKLQTHTESREMPIFALVLDRDDRRLGPQLKPSAVDCAALQAAIGRGGPPPAPSTDGRPQCSGRGGFGRMTAGGLTMTQFARQLSQLAGRIVTDRTGLEGGFDFDLTWMPTPDQIPRGAPPDFPRPPVDPNAPSLFTALQEQLGLKLEAARDAVRVLVIDRIEPPTEN